MALNGTVKSNAYDGRYIQLTWTATQNKEENTSTISWTLKGAGGATDNYYMAGNFKVVINSEQVYYSSSRIQLFNGTTVASGSKTINHNSNGDASLSISIEAGIYTYAVNCTGSDSFTLDNIPRATTPVLSKTTATMGESITITLNRISSNFTHDVAIYFGDKSMMLKEDVATSMSWTIPKSLAQWIPNASSMKAQITAHTYRGTTLIGSKSADITINISSDIKPSISELSVSEATEIADLGMYIQNMSKLKVLTTAEGIYNSTIKDIKVTVESIDYKGADVTTGTLTGSGQVDVNVVVTDSRSQTATKKQTITVEAYEPPKIINFNARRCDSAGNIKESGTHALVTYEFEIKPLNNKNAKSAVVKYGTDETLTELFSIDAYSGNSTFVSESLFELYNSYEVKFELSDSFNSTSMTVKISTERVPLELLYTGLGVSIGKAAELDETFDIDLYTLFRKNVDFNGTVNFTTPPNIPIPVINTGSINDLTTNGTYYLGNDVTDRPVNANGWLEVFKFKETNVYQRYTTYTGKKYERIMDSSTWQDWCGYFEFQSCKYTKYLDGRMECTMISNIPANFNTAVVANLYQPSYEIASVVPAGVGFASVDSVTLHPSVDNANSTFMLSNIGSYSVANKIVTIKYRLARQTQGQITVKNVFNIKGKWK